ncbi:hypothetical protein pipiens_007676 [Culex pipiens pipiens]|uniref:Uncharacterized protein n=1 Tax=Culex pipiens pipiens TaxID=38569 RepID=A0ABD1DK95_CULPP
MRSGRDSGLVAGVADRGGDPELLRKLSKSSKTFPPPTKASSTTHTACSTHCASTFVPRRSSCATATPLCRHRKGPRISEKEQAEEFGLALDRTTHGTSDESHALIEMVIEIFQSFGDKLINILHHDICKYMT